jgi:hypothetical protein
MSAAFNLIADLVFKRGGEEGSKPWAYKIAVGYWVWCSFITLSNNEQKSERTLFMARF